MCEHVSVMAVRLEFLQRMKQREDGDWQITDVDLLITMINQKVLLFDVFEDVAKQGALLFVVMDVWIAISTGLLLSSESDVDVLVCVRLSKQCDQVVERGCAHIMSQLVRFRMEDPSNCAQQGNVRPRVGRCNCRLEKSRGVHVACHRI